MTSVKNQTKSKNIRDVRYDKIKISDLPDDLIKSIREITLASDEDLIDLVNSAIAGREVTNNPDDVREWCENQLAKNTIVVAETKEEFYEIVCSAMMSLPNQCSMGIGNQKRGPIKKIADKTNGYTVEFAIRKWAKTIGIEINLAHEIGNVKQFIDSDFPHVLEDGKWRESKINVGAKSGKKNSLWMDVPKAQFKNTDYQMFGRCVTDGHNLEKEALMSLLDNKYFKSVQYPEYFREYMKSFIPRPISVYLVGFATKPQFNNFIYDGYKARKIFHITQMAGVVPENYKDVIREKENLPSDFKIEILCIKDFLKHKGDFCLWNSGSIMKTKEQIDELIRKL